jgi:hypothetical protein
VHDMVVGKREWALSLAWCVTAVLERPYSARLGAMIATQLHQRDQELSSTPQHSKLLHTLEHAPSFSGCQGLHGAGS